MLSKATEYAIRALVYIKIQNDKEEKPGFREIAGEIEAPEQFTAKILQNFTRNGLLHSGKGRGGGFFFEQGEEQLTIHAIIQIMEGNNYFNQCLFGFNFCDEKHPCPLHEDFIKIWEDFKTLAKVQTIQSLADKIENKKAYLRREHI